MVCIYKQTIYQALFPYCNCNGCINNIVDYAATGMGWTENVVPVQVKAVKRGISQRCNLGREREPTGHNP